MAKLKGPAIQWYYKQWLGDDKVLGMDWDAQGMHFWLINLSCQQDPAGTIPNDIALIRRWLRNPSDDVWRRVQPQIFSSWSLADGRWHQKGTEETAAKQVAFSESRSQAATKRWDQRDAYALRMQCEKHALQSSSSSSKLNTRRFAPNKPHDPCATGKTTPQWTPQDCAEYRRRKASKNKPVPPEIERYMQQIEAQA